MNLREYIQNGPKDRQFSDWIWGLYKWGKETQVRVACRFAKECLHVWERHSDFDEWRSYFGMTSIRNALQAAKTWLSDKSEENRLRAENALAQAYRDLEIAEFAVAEAGGSCLQVEARKKAVMAANAAIQACQAAVWTPEIAQKGFEHDPEEVKARILSGPALECYESVISAKTAMSLELDQIKELLLSS